jgi:hypothetical protein
MAVSVEEGIILCAMGWRKNINGARGGNRTHTALRPPDFESAYPVHEVEQPQADR